MHVWFLTASPVILVFLLKPKCARCWTLVWNYQCLYLYLLYTSFLHKYLENGFIVKDIYITDKGKNYKFSERVKALSFHDFNDYFSKVGFEVLEVLDSDELRQFDSNTSERMIFITKKL